MTKLEEMKDELKARQAKHDELIKLHRKEYISGVDVNKIDFSEDHKNDDRIQELEWAIKVEERREVKVGDGVTLCYYTDSQAFTVIKRTKTTITIQRDKATLDPNFKPEFITGGFAGHCVNQDEQIYTYERDANGTTHTARWSEKKGMFMVEGCLRVYNGRHEFYDYNF